MADESEPGPKPGTLLERYAAARGEGAPPPLAPNPPPPPEPSGSQALAMAMFGLGGIGAGMLLTHGVYALRGIDVSDGFRFAGLGLIIVAALARRAVGAVRRGGRGLVVSLGCAALGMAVVVFAARMPPISSVELTRTELPGFNVSLPAGERENAVLDPNDGKLEQHIRIGGRRGGIVLKWTRGLGESSPEEHEQLIRAMISQLGKVRELERAEVGSNQAMRGSIAVKDMRDAPLYSINCDGSDLSIMMLAVIPGEGEAATELLDRMAKTLECTATGVVADRDRAIPHIALPDRFGAVDMNGMVMFASWESELLRFDSTRTSARLPATAIANGMSRMAGGADAEFDSQAVPLGAHELGSGVEVDLARQSARHRDGDEVSVIDYYVATFQCAADLAFMAAYVAPHAIASVGRVLEVLDGVGCPRDGSPTLADLPRFEDRARAACEAGTQAACDALSPLR